MFNNFKEIKLEKTNLKILITGGSGLLTGRLAEFLGENHNITLLSRKNINNILSIKSLHTVTYHSLNDINPNVFDHDIIIHASGPNAIDSKVSHIASQYYNETKFFIDTASKSKTVKKFIFLSSIRAVSDNCQGIITENTNASPSSEYGKLKHSIENYLLKEKTEGNMMKIILRITNGYGRPVHYMSNCWNLIILDACRQAIKNKKITLRSKGMDYKDFIPIRTITEVIGNIVTDNECQASGIFNISSKESVRIIEFVELIIKKINNRLSTNINIELGSDEENKIPSSFTVDNTKIINNGWLKSIDHDKEINDLIEFCLNNQQEI